MAAQAETSRSTYVPRRLDAQIQWLEQLHATAESYKARRTRAWSTAAQVYRGNNWDTKKEGNPFFKTNLARAKLDRKAARMTASKPLFDVMPHRSGLTQTARLLQRTVHALWDALDMQMRLEQLSAFVRPFGCGFFKTVWDPRARHGLGDIVVAEIDPRRVTLDPYCLRAYDIERASVVIHETSMPYSWVVENFPRHAREVEDFSAPPPSASEEAENLAGRSALGGPIRSPLRYYLGGMRGQNLTQSGITPIPYVRIREFWYADPQTEDDRPLYPNGRVTYLIGSGRKAIIVNPAPEDSANPFFDGMWPFDLYDARPDIDHPWGSSQVEDIRRLEEAVNRSGHMALRQLLKNISIIIADGGALTPDYLKKLSDFGDIVINKTPGRDVTRLPAQNAVAESISLINVAKNLMDEIIGLGGDSPVSGRGRVELRSPDLLYGLQESQNDLINLEARRLESLLERVGQKVISRIFQYYRTDRLIPYVSTQGLQSFEFEVKKLRDEIYHLAFTSVAARLIAEDDEDEGRRKKSKVANFETVKEAVEQAIRGAWREFDFKIVPLSSLSTTRAARAKVMGQLAMEGQVPFRLMMEEAGFDNAEDLQKEALEEKKKMIELYQALGLPPPDSGQQKKKSSK